MSPDAFESPWVKLEMNTAIRLEREGRVLISPVLYRECKPPLLLSNYQWIQYTDEAATIQRLIGWVGPMQGMMSNRRWWEPRTLSEQDALSAQSGLDELAAAARVCTLCPLINERTIAVPGEGPAGAQIMLIGEAPGPEDDKTGVPFVSAAGEFLSELLDLVSVPRASVYMTNIVKCRPNKNRDPEPHEIRTCCDNYLDRQIELLQPKVIITLGAHALNRIAPGKKLSQDHGQPVLVGERIVFPMYHPAAALYRARYRNILIKDFIDMDKYLTALPVL
jgi:DNA polymerase